MAIPREHNYLGWFLLVAAVALMVIHGVLPEQSSRALLGVVSNFGSALLALAVVELVFKTFLQRDLVSDIARTFKNAVDLPVQAIYLGRSKLPASQSPLQIIRSARHEVYVKGISYAHLVTEGFADDLERELRGKQRPVVRFMLLSPNFRGLAEVASLTGLEPSVLKENSSQFARELETLAARGYPVEYGYYTSSPTAGLWLVDPEDEGGWCRVELYLYHREPQSSRASIVLRKLDAPSFFARLSEVISGEWHAASRQTPAKALLLSEREGSPAGHASVPDGRESPTWMQPAASRPGKGVPEHLLCITFSTTNLRELRSFYAQHDPMADAGFRGADRIPPRSDHGILRLLHTADPKSFIDLPLPGPTGIAYDEPNGRFLVACQRANRIVSVSREGVTTYLEHRLFNHLHSLDLHDGKLAVACSGTDSVLVFNVAEREPICCWIGPENGYSSCPDGSTRSIQREVDYGTSLFPTLYQATHVNSAVICRSDPSLLYASLFHQGEIVRIDMRSNKTSTVMSGLVHPHGLKSDGNGGYVLSLASSGRILVLDGEFHRLDAYVAPGVEWLQDVCGLSDSYYAFTDVYGAKLKLFHLPSHSIVSEMGYGKDLKAYQVKSLGPCPLSEFQWLRDLRIE